MNCKDALRFVSPYIDSELDARTSFEIAEHLETCQSCASRFASELALEKKVETELRQGNDQADAAIWERIDQKIRAEATAAPAAAAPGILGRRIAAAAAVVLLALGAIALIVTKRGTPAEQPFGLLGKSACHSHEGYVAGTETPELVSSAPAEVTTFFATKLGIAVRPPDPALLTFVGARRCAFGPVRVAFIMGRRGDEAVSAFVFPASELGSFPEARAALDAGAGRARGKCGGVQLFVEARRNLAVCVVAPELATSLEALADSLLKDAP